MESEVQGMSLINTVTTAVANHIKSEEKQHAACLQFVFCACVCSVTLFCLYRHSNLTCLLFFPVKTKIQICTCSTVITVAFKLEKC